MSKSPGAASWGGCECGAARPPATLTGESEGAGSHDGGDSGHTPKPAHGRSGAADLGSQSCMRVHCQRQRGCPMGEQLWVDKLAIQELIYRYSDSINRGDIEATESVFAAGAIWESPLLGMHFETARAFCAFLASNSAGVDLLIQTPHSPSPR